MRDARTHRIPWTAERPEPASDDPLLVALCATESTLRAEHDRGLDAVCALALPRVPRLRRRRPRGSRSATSASGPCSRGCPRDIERPPEVRIRTWAAMLHGNFADIRVDEDDEKFVITQDPCGSCGRQLASGAFSRTASTSRRSPRRTRSPSIAATCRLPHPRRRDALPDAGGAPGCAVAGGGVPTRDRRPGRAASPCTRIPSIPPHAVTPTH